MSRQSSNSAIAAVQAKERLGHEGMVPPSTLSDEAVTSGSSLGADMEAVKQAERAIEELSCNFEQWMRDEVLSLLQARSRYKSDPKAPEAAHVLLRVAHDMKGQASTLQYPYVSRVCASLCSLFEDVPSMDCIPMVLVDHHVDAVNAIVKEGVREDEHPTAEALVVQLASVTAEYVACEALRITKLEDAAAN